MRAEARNNETGSGALDLTFPYPFSRIGIEINQKCNLRCSYCWNQQWAGKEIDIEKVKKILNALRRDMLNWEDKRTPNICFYAAEPFLSFDILKEILQYPFFFSIITNGTLLDEKYYDVLLEKRPALLVSLDGIKENHNYYRGDSFDKIVANIIKYPHYSDISLAMTVNLSSLKTLYQSLEFMWSLPVSSFECHLNLYEEWTDELFQQYIDIVEKFICDYTQKTCLPGYELHNRFANLANARVPLKDRGGALLQIDIDGQMLIEKPNRSCLILPEMQGHFFGRIFANENGFVSEEMKQKYFNFMEQGEYSHYNYISDKCSTCSFSKYCEKDRQTEVYLYPKECYPILEDLILYEKFWEEKNGL